MLGDSDDGYVLDLGAPHEVHELFSVGAVLFGRADFKALAGAYRETARWLLGASSRAEFDGLPSTPGDEPLSCHAFPESGHYLLQCGHRGRRDAVSVVFDCGDLGFTAIAAHGHADALSFTLRAFGRDVLVDPGTYDYFTHPAWRTYFRSTSAHNTVLVDGLDQSVMLGPFLWGARATARCLAWAPTSRGGKVVGEHDGYRRLADPVLHRRTLALDGPSRILTVEDEIVAEGAHDVAMGFHLAEGARLAEAGRNRYVIAVDGDTVTLTVDARLTGEIHAGSEEPIAGWVSRRYHRKVPSTTLVARGRSRGRTSYTSRLEIGPAR
jgi:uncharacterized heparinase superfamily protein